MKNFFKSLFKKNIIYPIITMENDWTDVPQTWVNGERYIKCFWGFNQQVDDKNYVHHEFEMILN